MWCFKTKLGPTLLPLWINLITSLQEIKHINDVNISNTSLQEIISEYIKYSLTHQTQFEIEGFVHSPH